MLEKVLSIRRTVFHTSYEFHEFDVHTVDSKVNAGSLTGLEDFILKLFLDLSHDLFNTCRMDTSVHDKLMERKTCDFSSDRVEGRKKNRIRSIVHYDFHTGSSLQSPDVTTFATDDSTFDIIVLDREGGDRILNGSLSRCPLYRGDYYSLGFPRCIQSGIIHRIVYIRLGLASRLSLHVFHEKVLGFVCGHAGDALNLLVGLLAE